MVVIAIPGVVKIKKKVPARKTQKGVPKPYPSGMGITRSSYERRRSLPRSAR